MINVNLGNFGALGNNSGFGGLSRDQYIDSFIRIANEKKTHYLFDDLTEDEKKDIVEINGRRWIRKLAPVEV